jgi:hypothetical protein
MRGHLCQTSRATLRYLSHLSLNLPGKKFTIGSKEVIVQAMPQLIHPKMMEEIT